MSKNISSINHSAANSARAVGKHIVDVHWPLAGLCRSVKAFTTTRQRAGNTELTRGYASFNLGLHVGDDPTRVSANRASLGNQLPNGANIQWLNQVHGAEVAVIAHHQQEPVTADAAVTRLPHLALAVMTADCLPILLSDKSGQVIGAIHGGWRPLAQNIIQRTIEAMGGAGEQLVAWLGPCIGPTAFEVGEEVKSAFTALDTATGNAFKRIPSRVFPAQKETALEPQKYLADLHQLATVLLNTAGVTAISRLAHCTYSMPEHYYSFRRENITGRMATVICRR
ncbi:peptidoglycan editing factor PgeF [Thalassotalea euphylliae]|uniref:Purine nucleoside phosphorylase n=1 Tax=Thalassotalea euphylliae TaxID=1655234 RepID=A0A3E0TN94_9GAMM|nr:peptidoglycan editing factor PgeF [Thalassotalea euphylliae]REL26014.1 peptidoglycan editing factor PgeF [Thalassotalea euphylliae]